MRAEILKSTRADGVDDHLGADICDELTSNHGVDESTQDEGWFATTVSR